jgi:hypothetical protein
MEFELERMDLTDSRGALDWTDGSAVRPHGETRGSEVRAVLAAVVARDGGVQLGIAAVYADGQAVVVARKGDAIYAVRAVPRTADIATRHAPPAT